MRKHPKKILKRLDISSDDKEFITETSRLVLYATSITIDNYRMGLLGTTADTRLADLECTAVKVGFDC